jgi:DNA-binding MarR family transcriptional regulator
MPKKSDIPTPTHADDVEALVRQLYSLGRVRREIDRHALAELGGQGFLALGIIHLHGPVRVSDVAHRLAVDLSVASRQVAALTKAGYAQRERDTADGRAQLVSSTKRGHQVLADCHRRMVAAFGAAVADWSLEDLVTLTELLGRLRADFDALHEIEVAA